MKKTMLGLVLMSIVSLWFASAVTVSNTVMPFVQQWEIQVYDDEVVVNSQIAPVDVPPVEFVEPPMAEEVIATMPTSVPMPIKWPPPFPIYGDGIFIEPPYLERGQHSQMDMLVHEYCEPVDSWYSCGKYADVVQRLDPKISWVAATLQEKFDEDQLENITRRLWDLIMQKFYQVKTEKSKFIVSYVWVALQEELFAEDVEDIEGRLWDALTNFTSQWRIASVNWWPWDTTFVDWDTISVSSNRFNLEVEALFESERPISYEHWYELIWYFWEVGKYFMDREKLIHFNYNQENKSWKIEWEWRRVPDDISSFSVYLMCEYCEGEVFHKDRSHNKIADQRSFNFIKLDDDVLFDAWLDAVTSRVIAQAWDEVIVEIDYRIDNNGRETIYGLRSQLYVEAYPNAWLPGIGMWGGRYYDYYDGSMDRNVIVSCNWQAISESEFLQWNIELPVSESCTVSERVTLKSVPIWYLVSSNLYIEAWEDQNRENNEWSTTQVVE